MSHFDAAVSRRLFVSHALCGDARNTHGDDMCNTTWEIPFSGVWGQAMSVLLMAVGWHHVVLADPSQYAFTVKRPLHPDYRIGSRISNVLFERGLQYSLKNIAVCA
jgi:hypothetical protein